MTDELLYTKFDTIWLERKSATYAKIMRVLVIVSVRVSGQSLRDDTYERIYEKSACTVRSG